MQQRDTAIPATERTHQVIPDEAVEAGAKAFVEVDPLWPDGAWEDMTEDQREDARGIVGAALEAAAPYMRKVITDYDELDALPVETVIRTAFGTAREKNDRGYWYEMGSDYANGIEMGSFPAVVLYVPEVNA